MNPFLRNQELDRIPQKDAKILMVGDAYLTDIVGGNLAGVDTALVNPYHFFSQPLDLLIARSMDRIIGTVMTKITPARQKPL